MKKKYNILIVENQPIITEVYINTLQHISSLENQLIFEIDTSCCCKSAYEKIEVSLEKEQYDIIFLALKVEPFKSKKLLSGEDLGIKIKKMLPEVKIIISTFFNNNYRIYNIFKSLNPDGLILTNDLTSTGLKNAILDVIFTPPYYSKTVMQILRNEISSNIFIDKLDREILYELSLGTRMNELPSIIPLSIAGIEKRKRNLKEIFDVNRSNDRDLLFAAREKGFI